MPVGERIVEVVKPLRRSVDQAERYLRIGREFQGETMGKWDWDIRHAGLHRSFGGAWRSKEDINC